jgi:hypothetical protein
LNAEDAKVIRKGRKEYPANEPLSVLFLELFHKRDERLNAFARESVIDRGAYAAD